MIMFELNSIVRSLAYFLRNKVWLLCVKMDQRQTDQPKDRRILCLVYEVKLMRWIREMAIRLDNDVMHLFKNAQYVSRCSIIMGVGQT